jgi:hypothetical protein
VLTKTRMELETVQRKRKAEDELRPEAEAVAALATSTPLISAVPSKSLTTETKIDETPAPVFGGESDPTLFVLIVDDYLCLGRLCRICKY